MNIFVPGYLEIMVTRQQQFCCIFASTKDKFGYFLKKLFHSRTSHTYNHYSSLFLNRHKNIHAFDLSFSAIWAFINEHWRLLTSSSHVFSRILNL
jgi:hypothetical protein